MATEHEKLAAARGHLQAALAIIDDLGLSLIGARLNHVFEELGEVEARARPEVFRQAV